MDKKVVGVIGAIAGLAALDQAAQATPAATPTPDPMNARSFAELLDPIPNAVAALRAADAAARDAQAAAGQNGDVQLAGWRHHHHHHNRWRSEWRWRHHHHHHHHRAIIRLPGVRIGVPHHHHHHHHHHFLSY